MGIVQAASDRIKHLNRQIEFIRDTESTNTFEVVVRVGSGNKDDPTIVAAVAETLRRRGLSSSARDVLPVAHQTLRSSSGAGLRNHERSIAAQVAQAPVTRSAHATLRKNGLSALQPLLKSDAFRKAAAGAKEAKSRTAASSKPTAFWSSSSVVLPVRGDALDQLAAVPNVEDIFPNRRLFVPPVVVPKQVPQSVDDNKVSGWGVRLIGALATWGAFDARGRGVTIGVLDTGVDASHPDLRGKIAHWAEFDSQGKPVQGSKPHDSDIHGTHCAGTIAGGNASGRWIGVAPEAKIAAGLVLNGKQGGTHAQILAGMDWAINKQVDAISMSLGGLVLGAEVPSTYTKAILNALRVGIPVVTAIGNDGSQTTGSPGNDIFAFAVGATDPSNRAAGFSGGRTQIIRESEFFAQAELPLAYSKPDVSAPGVAIYSSVPGGKWEYLNGTSMATPHVAGAIALLLSGTKIKTAVPPNQRAFVIQDLLTGSAEELGEAGQNHRFGFGRIDILRALGFARDLGYN
ncbi:MAG TPA: S8 family serine peptidase [Xanthobacteraceae bacterium]|nr:S8 family serine peptidase [Xanthobacteraceae bacterium]